MGRARGSNSGVASERGRTRARAHRRGVPASSTTAASASVSGFDGGNFMAPDANGGDLAWVNVETYTEGPDYYSNQFDTDYYADDDYYPNPLYDTTRSYRAISSVTLECPTPKEILLTTMQKHAGAPFVEELKRNPYYFYGAVRAAQRFRHTVTAAPVEWNSERDYYGDTVTDVEVGPEYAEALSVFEAELEELYALSVGNENNKIIEQGLIREYGHLIPKVTDKNFVIKKVAVTDIVKRRTSTNSFAESAYVQELWYLQATSRSRQLRNADETTREFTALAKTQPQLLVNANDSGKYVIIDGHHRFRALTKWVKPAPKYVYVLVAQ